MEIFLLPKAAFETWRFFSLFSPLEGIVILFFILLLAYRLFGQKPIDRRLRAIHMMEAGEDLDRRLERGMEQIYDRVSPSRVILFQYYSDSKQMTGIPNMNIRITHIYPPSIHDVQESDCEDFNPDQTIDHSIFASLQRGVPGSFFTCLKRHLQADSALSFPDINTIKEEEPGIHDLLKKMGVRSAYVFGLYDIGQRLIGFVFLHFQAQFLGDFQDDDMAYIKERVGDINIALTFNRYDTRGRDR
jgi:hypothetical protein